jgi:hypothetical protein
MYHSKRNLVLFLHFLFFNVLQFYRNWLIINFGATKWGSVAGFEQFSPKFSSSGFDYGRECWSEREVYLSVLRCPLLIGFDLLPRSRVALYCTWCIKWRGKEYKTDKLYGLEYYPCSGVRIITLYSRVGFQCELIHSKYREYSCNKLLISSNPYLRTK